MTPFATVHVLAYNHGPFIGRCLESLVAQKTTFEFEILVGEDCSTDDTRKQVTEMAAKHPGKIRPILNKKNLGALANSRKLIEEARGKYIAFCEGDDFWQRPDKLQRQVDLLASDPSISLVCSDVDVKNETNGRTLHSVDRRIGLWNSVTDDLTLDLLLGRVGIHTCSACMRTTELRRVIRVNPFEFSSGFPLGDLQTWLEFSRLGRIVHFSESLATYRVSSGSSTRPANPAKLAQFWGKVNELMEHYCTKFGYGTEVRAASRSRMFRVLAHAAIASRKDELREAAIRQLAGFPFSPRGFEDGFLRWSVGGRWALSLASVTYPPYQRLARVSSRLGRLLRRVPRGS